MNRQQLKSITTQENKIVSERTIELISLIVGDEQE